MPLTMQRKLSMHDNKLLLERYSAGEVDNDESLRIKEHCKSCAECAGYLETLKADKREFLAAHPFPLARKVILPNRRQPWRASFFDAARRPAWAPAYALIAVILMVSPIVYFRAVHHPATEDITFKGRGEAISFLVKRNGNISVCTTLDTLLPGDEIQALYSLTKPKFMSLLSVDSYGAVSWYHPDQKSRFCSIPAKPGRNQNYPAGILLDDSKGRELVVALFSDSPLQTGTVSAWVTQAIKKTNTNLSLLGQELDATKDTIKAYPLMTLFQKGR
jgi:hypothetical protein